MATIDSAGPGPQDVVVVLCRGASRRFGEPKALAAVGGDPRPLLARVAGAYDATAAGLLLVVTTAALEPGCRACLRRATARPFEVVAGPEGGGTARTMAAAARWLEERGAAVGLVWAHPVDLPRVRARTLSQLARVAAAWPGRAVRPVWGSVPGHPVVLPWALLAGMSREAGQSEGSWRDVLAAAVARGHVPWPVEVRVADPGVILDHDEPDGAPAARED